MDKNDLINLKKELEKNCMSLQKFLINYCGIYNKKIHDIKISHQDIKELMPHLKRVSFESLLENKNSFYTGSIIPVKDSYNNVIPYVNPTLEYDVVIEFDCDIKTEQKIIDNQIIDGNLNIYELAKLCRYFKTHNKMKEYRFAYKKLKREKGKDVKQYKKKRDKLIMKGREQNDEY